MTASFALSDRTLNELASLLAPVVNSL